MINGRMYDAADPELAADRRNARELCRELNTSADSEEELRRRICCELFGGCGNNLKIEPPFRCDYGYNISIGEDVFFNFDCVILDPAPVVIGSSVLFGPGVHLYTATHPLNAAERDAGLESAAPITIGAKVWIGGRVVVGAGVRIGARSSIGTGSVVLRDIPEDVFAAGSPCRVIRAADDPPDTR